MTAPHLPSAPEPASASGAGDASGDGRGRKPRWGWLLLAIALTLVGMIVALLVALERPTIGTWIVNAALSRVSVAPRAVMTVGEARIHVLSGFELRTLRLMRRDTLLAKVDTLSARYRLSSLLAGRLEVQRLDVAGVVVTADIADTSCAEPGGRALTLADLIRGRFYAGPAIAIDAIQVRDARYSGRATPDSGLGTLRIALEARQVRLGGGFSFVLDRLAARVQPPGVDAPPIDLELAASLADGRLDVRSTAAGPASDVTARGHLALDRRDALADVALVLEARPLALEDLAAIAPGLPLAGSSTISLDLHGARPDRLAGRASIGFERVRLGAVALGRSRVDQAWADGRADTRLVALYQGAAIAVDGWIRPLDRRPTYDLVARTDHLPDSIPGAPWWTPIGTRTHARVTLAARGSGYTHPALDVTGRVEGVPGTIDLDGRLDLTRDITWVVRRLAWEGLDVARVLGDTGSSSLSGSLTGEGRVERGTVHMRAALHMDPSHYGRWSVGGADARAGVDGSRLALRLDVDTNAGRLEVDSLTARLTGPGSFRVAGARFRSFDLAAITGQDVLASRLDGTLTAEGRGLTALTGWGASQPGRVRAAHRSPPGTGAPHASDTGPLAALRDGRVSAHVRLELGPSGFRDVPIAHARIEGSLAQGAVDLEADLASRGGQLDLAGSARPFDPTPGFGIRRGRFTDVDLAAWTGSEALRSRLSGEASGGGSIVGGSDHRPARLSVRIDRSPIGHLVIDGGEALAFWTRSQAQLTADLKTAGDTLSARADANYGDHPPHGSLECSLPLKVLAVLAGRDSLPTSGRVAARATWSGDDPATALLSATVTGSGSIDRARLDSLLIAARLRQGALLLDTLSVTSNVGVVAGAGRVAVFDSAATAPTDLHVALTLRDASPLKRLFGADTLAVGSGTVGARLGGTRGAPTCEVDLSLRSLAWNTVRLLRVDGAARGAFDGAWRPTRFETRATLDRLQAFDVSVDDLTAQASYRDGEARFDLASAFDPHHGLLLAGRSRIDSLGTHVTLDTLAVRADSAAWTLDHPARIDLSSGRMAVDGFAVGSDRGRITAHGVIDRRGDQSFRMEARGVGLDMVLAWLGRKDVHGTLDGGLALDGPATAPTGTASLAVALAAGEHQSGVLRSEMAWNGTRLDLGGRLATEAGDSLSWGGHLPLAFSLAADTASTASRVRVLEGHVDMRLTADHFPLQAFSIFLDPASVGTLGGTLDVDARLQGDNRALVGSGHLQVSGGVVPLPGLGATYRDIDIQAGFQDDSLVVRRAHLASGKGTLDATGRVRFVSVSRVEPRLHITGRRFGFAKTSDLEVNSTLALDLSGTVTQPVVRGTVSVENTNVTFKQSDLAAAAGDVRLSDADVRMMEETFGYVKRPGSNAGLTFYDASDLDLGVTLGGNCWVRQRVQPQLSLALTGQFRLRKAPHGEPELYGRVEPVPQRGYVEEFARNFDITGGEVMLNGKTKDHVVNIQAEYKPPTSSESDASKTRVLLAVEGTTDQLKLTLSSEPAMSDAEIVNFIATGRSRFDASTTGAQGSTLAKDIGLSQVTGVAEQAAQEAIGLDVLQVRFDALQGATLVSGSYLNPKLYVGIRQPLQYKDSSSPTSTETYRTRYEVEYAIHRWLVVNLQGETSTLRSFIRARHAY